MKKLFMLCVLMMLFSAANVWASGLSIPEQGAAAMGMSAAMTARSEDLSSIFYNPAGIDYVENFEVLLGITPIMPSHKYSPLTKDSKIFNSIDSESNMFLPPQLFAAYRVHQNVILGLGVYAPFGLGTEWKDTWNGRYTSTYSEIQTIYVNPTIAIVANKKVTIGLGASYVTSSATIEKMIDTGGMVSPNLAGNTKYESKFALNGDGTGFSYNIGTIIRTVEKFQFGVSYRSAYDMKYEGKAKFKNSSAPITVPDGKGGVVVVPISTAVATKLPTSQDGKATLHMPWMLNFGLKYDVSETWDTSFDLDIVGWSVYNDLTIDFKDNKPYDKQTQVKDWTNSFVLRGGTSYDINKSFVARGGILFDKNPVPDETFDGQLPDSNRYGLSLGCGYKIGKIQLDASYMLLNFSKRIKENGVGFSTDTTKDGTIDRFDVPTGYPVGNGNYQSRAHLLSVSASMKF